MVTSIGVIWISSHILRRLLSVTLSSSLEIKKAGVLTEPAWRATLELICNTHSHAFQSAGGIAFVWKKRVRDLLYVTTLLVFLIPRESMQNREMPS